MVVPGLLGHHHLQAAQWAAGYFHSEKHNAASCNFYPLVLAAPSGAAELDSGRLKPGEDGRFAEGAKMGSSL